MWSITSPRTGGDASRASVHHRVNITLPAASILLPQWDSTGMKLPCKPLVAMELSVQSIAARIRWDRSLFDQMADATDAVSMSNTPRLSTKLHGRTTAGTGAHEIPTLFCPEDRPELTANPYAARRSAAAWPSRIALIRPPRATVNPGLAEIRVCPIRTGQPACPQAFWKICSNPAD